jgi:tetratricopeptide (TPR) repeat protein
MVSQRVQRWADVGGDENIFACWPDNGAGGGNGRDGGAENGRWTMSGTRETKRRVEYTLGYLGLGMFAEATAELEGIAAAEQLLPVVRSLRVDLHIAQKQWKRTVVVAGELARAHPALENAWIGWAYALRELQRVQEARAVLVAAEPHHGKTSAVLHYNLACYDSLLGALKSAKTRLAKACRMDEQFKAAAREDPDLAALRAAGMVE